MTTLYSYIVRYDEGFAPNPFHRVCTLACCKPGIRRTARKWDYVIGLTGAEYRKSAVEYRVVYAMRITEEPMTFEEYSRSARYQIKRPDMNAGTAKTRGDNIYHKDNKGNWKQDLSWHSHRDGTPCLQHQETDLGGEKVLASRNFIYWGCDAPPLPSDLSTLIVGRNYKRFRSHVRGEREVVENFIDWFEGKRAKGFKGRLSTPFDWE